MMDAHARAVLSQITVDEVDPHEVDEMLAIFGDYLRAVLEDGNRKRHAGVKVSWKVDPEHEQGFFSHIARWKRGEKRDPDSGAHPLVHCAVRALMLAYQERR